MQDHLTPWPERYRTQTGNNLPGTTAPVWTMPEAKLYGSGPTAIFWEALNRALKQGCESIAKELSKDASGHALARFHLERFIDHGLAPASAKREAFARLKDIAPWPFPPTPTGWRTDGFPEDLT